MSFLGHASLHILAVGSQPRCFTKVKKTNSATMLVFLLQNVVAIEHVRLAPSLRIFNALSCNWQICFFQENIIKKLCFTYFLRVYVNGQPMISGY